MDPFIQKVVVENVLQFQDINSIRRQINIVGLLSIPVGTQSENVTGWRIPLVMWRIMLLVPRWLLSQNNKPNIGLVPGNGINEAQLFFGDHITQSSIRDLYEIELQIGNFNQESLSVTFCSQDY